MGQSTSIYLSTGPHTATYCQLLTTNQLHQTTTTQPTTTNANKLRSYRHKKTTTRKFATTARSSSEDCQQILKMNLNLKVLMAVSLFSGCYFLSEAANPSCSPWNTVHFLGGRGSFTKDDLNYKLDNNNCPQNRSYCDMNHNCRPLVKKDEPCGIAKPPCADGFSCLAGVCVPEGWIRQYHDCTNDNECKNRRFPKGQGFFPFCTMGTKLCVHKENNFLGQGLWL